MWGRWLRGVGCRRGSLGVLQVSLSSCAFGDCACYEGLYAQPSYDIDVSVLKHLKWSHAVAR